MIATAALLVAAVALALALAVGPTAAQSRFDGVTITVGVMDASAVGGPARTHARSWEARTGGRVDLRAYPFDGLFDAFETGLRTGQPAFDVIFYAPAWAGDYFPYLAEVPQDIAENEAFDDIHPTYRDRLMRWDNRWVAITIDGDLFSGYYRRDLFEDPVNRRDFRSRYGYELGPPDTWGQYRDIAAFFSGRTDAEGRPLYGTTEAFAPGTQEFWTLFSRAAAYTNHPDHPGAQFFDPETMAPAVDRPGWGRAAQDYLEIFRYCPPGSERFGIVEAREAFISGRTAMTLDWGDTALLAADPARSRVVDRVGYFVLPGTMAVWNPASRRWDAMSEAYKVTFLAFGGWVASVPAASHNQVAAWDYLMWYSSPENSLRDIVTPGSGINPYRFSHFTSIDAWTQALSPAAAAGFLQVIHNSLDAPHVALDLRIPGFSDYTRTLETHITRALAGELTVEEALHRTAEDWEAITERRGRAAQRALYRASMGLPP